MSIAVRIGCYVGVLMAAGAYAASPYRIGITYGTSMEPTYHNGQPYLLERPHAGRPVRRGDVVLFRRAGQTYMKRVLALPGDRFYVLARKPGEYDAEELVRDWELPRIRRMIEAGWTACRIVQRVVPAGHLYVVGDNMLLSEDSRSFGFVELESVVGRIIDAPATFPRAVRHLAWARDKANG